MHDHRGVLGKTTAVVECLDAVIVAPHMIQSTMQKGIARAMKVALFRKESMRNEQDKKAKDPVETDPEKILAARKQAAATVMAAAFRRKLVMKRSFANAIGENMQMPYTLSRN